ncbi:MAG TPA: histidine phosphatase family protein [Bryobacteraceae bacterium]|jgi:broad specificity phosphatase PhoE|nr:histidine phosphatase family protein [Bryobacteraceae bacterium]
MSVLYLVRHGQAGTRENYDSLSELGRRQARLLGEHFRAQGISFAAAYSGSLARQKATAGEVLPDAEITVDSGWDEFDLAQVYREYAPMLSRDDEQFRVEYEAMQRDIEVSRGAHGDAVHRKWNDCDKKCVRAWVEGRYSYSGESWNGFVSRIHSALGRVVGAAHEGNVAVFTSATPIGVSAARTLEIEDGRAMWLAAVMFNTSVTTLRVHLDEVRLFTLNGIAHLGGAELRTFR